jgi:hypothetical protein
MRIFFSKTFVRMKFATAFIYCGIYCNYYKSFCQSEEYMFTHFKSLGDKKVVYLRLALYQTKKNKIVVIEVLLEDASIFDVNIYQNGNEAPHVKLQQIQA